MFYLPKLGSEEDINDYGDKQGKIHQTVTKSFTFVSLLALGLISSCNAEKIAANKIAAAGSGDDKVNPQTPSTTTPATTPTPTTTTTDTTTTPPSTINEPPVTGVYAAVAVNIDYQVGGTVVDSNTNKPIADATVAFLQTTTKTDAKGTWSIKTAASDCTTTQACQITVKATKLGADYQDATQQLVDTDTSSNKFVSLGNVTKLSSGIPGAVALYAVMSLYMITPIKENQ